MTEKTSEICFMNAIDLLAMIRSREVSAREVAIAFLEQIDRINGQVNAICTRIPDEDVLLQADATDRRITKGEAPGPLGGLPIAIKDLAPTRGIRTTLGSPIFSDQIPDFDGLHVERIKNAGAIVIGKTNTPEFGAGSNTFNSVFGMTCNPYDLTKTAGGSSGGAAAALATGMLPIADGSDMGGSLRNPAGFCNVIGFRSTIGRIPSWPQKMLWQSRLAVEGPMARSVQDCAHLFKVMAGPDDRDPLSLGWNTDFESDLNIDTGNKVIGWSPDLGGLPIEPQVSEVFEQARSHFESLNCLIKETHLDLRDAMDVFRVFRANYFAESTRDFFQEHRQEMKQSVIENAEAGYRLSGLDLSAADAQRTSIYHRMREFFTEHDFLVTPTTQVAPFNHEIEWVSNINGLELPDYIDWMAICCVITVTGLPAISVPCGFTAGGLPIGLQIVGRPGKDWEVLQMAHMFESVTGFATTRPSVVQPFLADEKLEATHQSMT